MERLKQMIRNRQNEVEALVKNYEKEINEKSEVSNSDLLFQKNASELYVKMCEKVNR